MRFRVVNLEGMTRYQLLNCAFWILFTLHNATRHSRYFHAGDRRFYQFMLLFWIALLAFNLYFAFFGTAEFESSALRLRGSFRAMCIPYASIVSFAPLRRKDGTPQPNTVELEIARVAADVYPHQYRVLRLKETDAFLAELQRRLQSAV